MGEGEWKGDGETAPAKNARGALEFAGFVFIANIYPSTVLDYPFPMLGVPFWFGSSFP